MNAEAGKPPPPRAEGVVQRHVEWMKLRNLRANSISNRRYALGRLAAWADGPILYLTARDLERWQADRSRQIAVEPLRTETSHVRNFYKWAASEGYIDVDPALKLIMPRVVRPLPRPMSEADFTFALQAADRPTRLILALAGYAGLRAFEIARLSWADIDLVERELRVVDGKAGRPRRVPISGALAELLDAAARRGHRHGPVIRRMDGRDGHCGAWRISSRANDFLHDQGIPETLHQLRHRFATVAYRATLDLRATQELLGHSNPATTTRYAAAAGASVRAAVEAAGQLGASQEMATAAMASRTTDSEPDDMQAEVIALFAAQGAVAPDVRCRRPRPKRR